MAELALITGASGGIGREFAKVFAENGCDLALVARSADKLEAVRAETEAEYGVRVLCIPCDLTAPGAADAVEQALGGRTPGVLVNNAGFGDEGPYLGSDWERQRSMIALNVTALAEFTHRFGTAMAKRGGGRILNVASIAAFSAGPYMSVYYASKAFVLSFSEALAEENRGTGVTVTALCPGPTTTGFEKASRMKRSVMFTFSRPADPETVARRGYRACMAGKVSCLCGQGGFWMNAASRVFPRAWMRWGAKKVDWGMKA